MARLLLYDYISSICSQMARLALVEKQLEFERKQVDIMENNEQFEPWYVKLNPRAVVPTLQISDEVVTDTIRIVNRVQEFPGPDLSGDQSCQAWLRDIMDLHYGVLMYRQRLDPDGTAPQIVARGKFLHRLAAERPDLSPVISQRIEGNRRFQELLKDPAAIELHVAATRALVDRMINAVRQTNFLAGNTYSLADCFATAALARFKIHGFEHWWSGTPLDDYYESMRSRPSFAVAEVIETGSERDL